MGKTTFGLLFIILVALLALASWWPQQRVADTTAGPIHQPWTVQAVTDRRQLYSPGSSGLQGLPPELVQAISPKPAPLPGDHDRLILPLPGDQSVELAVRGSIHHDNGDLTVHAGNADPLTGRAVLTWGESGLFGRIHAAEGLYLVHTDATGSWLIDLNDPRLEVDHFHGDTLGSPVLHPAAATSRTPPNHSPEAMVAALESDGQLEQIDVMFIYTPDMLQRYPNGLIETRLNHLIAVANQAMVDSRAPIVVRLVHHRSVNYSRHQNNQQAIGDLVRAMHGEHVPGLDGVRQDRANYGADIVALTWPHDIERRGACGFAHWPRFDEFGIADPNYGVHIDNDGISNWSVCSDAVFTHELGHNLGAEHQRSRASVDNPFAHNYAFVRDQRFHTVMGSFGTGDVNRYLRLDVFSNPNIRCGGEPCGSMSYGLGANNARKITELAPVVSGYARRIVPGLVQRPPPSEPDSDGDGVNDWEDPFPFDPFDGQLPPEAAPPLEFSERALRKPEQTSDWELLVISRGNSQVLSYGLDGRFRAVVARPEAVDAGPVLTEFSDMDVDEYGMLYLLASGDVRRFDRLSGRLIDVFLDSQRPQPADLQSPFPRAMGWMSNGQLVVLGADVIERYDDRGRQLNGRSSADNPQKHPDNWNRVLDLPLRTFTEHQGRLLVADAEFNRIMRFDTITGMRRTDAVPPGNGHISDPRNLAMGPEGLLYVANGSAGNVLRFDADTGSLVDVFIPAGRGGLSFARALAFGPDGDLYVACSESSQVLRFDGVSGEHLATVVSADDDRLDSPEGLLIAPVVDQIHAGHSGHYFVPDRGGEGWLLEVLNEHQAVVSWFTYPATGGAGEQAWALGMGQIEGSRIHFDEVIAARLDDPALGYDAGNLNLVDWGTMTFEFSHCDYGIAEFDSPLKDASGRLAFSRLARIGGLPCGSVPLAPVASAPGISGQWFDPGTNGQGWYLQEVRPNRVFAAWFTYDADGEQAWIVGEGELDGRALEFKDLIMTRGTWFGEDFVSDQIEQLEWGTMHFQFTACDRATVEFDSVLPQFGSGTLHAERLTALHGLQCEFLDQ